VSEPLAHSARKGASEQTYRAHIGEVVRMALEFGHQAAAFAPKWQGEFLGALELAANYHDLGKLDEIFQDDLLHNHRKTRLNHVDAGTAYLLKGKHTEAAVATYAHHLGLPSFRDEKAKNANGLAGMFRDLENDVGSTGLKTHLRTNAELVKYVAIHNGIFPAVSATARPGFSGLVRRLLLSCLVDADHSDTARHYGNERPVASPKLCAAERLTALDHYVAALADNASLGTERERLRYHLRQEVYRVCRERRVSLNDPILACDSPVGTGKTTAVMAYLLRVAVDRGLRRIFVVLPFTNIIDQSVDIYRHALRLPGETPAEMQAVVAAHHHRVDYCSYELRHLASRWDSPVVVTTAVQFFETLAASRTADLRKFHQVAGSAIFVDEAHAAVPAAVWPQMLRWLRELCDEWGCQLVLASGSLARFWELPEFVDANHGRPIPELISGEVREQSSTFEEQRVRILSRPDALSLSGLADFVLSKPGPRLVVLNTVQSAAVLANYLRKERNLGLNVEHISTALIPLDRSETVHRIRQHLSSAWKDWCLIATSCVEAGVDFSFRTAFRESWGLVNLLQIAGRASRSGEYQDTEIWDFRHDSTGGLSVHPQSQLPSEILSNLFKHSAKQGRQPQPVDCTEVLRLELRNDRGKQAQRMEEIERAERAADYPQVADLCRVIDAPTKTVLVSPSLIKRIKNHDRTKWPTWREIINNSVQIWSTRLDEGKLPVEQVGPDGELWALIEGNYDSFLGWMKGVLPLLQGQQQGGFAL
jgi:CRISPR-associated endonuclease/helicase Cas3